MKLLIAHDNKANLRLLRRILAGEGFAVVEAADAAQGLRLLKEHGPDAIISDVPFPTLDGYGCDEEGKSPFTPKIIAALRRAPRRLKRVLRGRAAQRRLRRVEGDTAVLVRKAEGESEGL